MSMSELKTTPNIDNPDGFYEELLKLHEGMSEADSHALNARLVLILANHIGARDILTQAMKLAKEAN